ncbi:hypothetical protein K466DRAFT_486714, partial [Polyporus arcularius HHB13444]
LGLLIYEYVITLRREVDFFWKRKLTGASVLFFLNRYLPLVVNAVSFVGLAPLSDKYIPWGAFSALRVFALSGRSWPLAILVFVLAFMPFAINCYTYTFLASINDPVIAVTIASRTSLIASDLLVIITTLVVTHSAVRLHGEGRIISHSFAGTLLRDVLLILNALHLTFTMLPIVDASLAPVSYMTLFTEPITAVLVSRFMLNLQAVNKRAMYGGSQLETLTHHLGSVNFERVVGSLGSDVLPSLSTDTEDSQGGELEGSTRDHEMSSMTEEGRSDRRCSHPEL